MAPRTKPAGAPQARALLTITSVAATLAGWSVLASAPAAPVAVASAATELPAWLAEPPTIPDLPDVDLDAPLAAGASSPAVAAPLREVTPPASIAPQPGAPRALATSRSSR